MLSVARLIRRWRWPWWPSVRPRIFLWRRCAVTPRLTRLMGFPRCGYWPANRRRMRGARDGATSTVRPNCTVTGFRFLRRKLFRLPYIRMILPPPVTRKRAAVPLWVFSLGTSVSCGCRGDFVLDVVFRIVFSFVVLTDDRGGCSGGEDCLVLFLLFDGSRACCRG